MESKEFIVKEKFAIAITSIARSGDTLYLGLTGGTQCLAAFDTKTEKIELCPPIFPWVENRGYCAKIHNAMSVLSDGTLLLAEGNHFTWDGIPVTVNYFNRELPESMLYRKRAGGYPDAKYEDFCLKNLENWNRTETDTGGVIMRYLPDTGETEIIGRLPRYLYAQSMLADPVRGRAFGHTIPDNHFFYVDMNNKTVEDFGRISDYGFHNMLVAPNGVCYAAWVDKADGALKLLRFNPDRHRLDYLDKMILKDPGAKVAGNQGIDQWIVTRSGEIYLGMVANSLLLHFDWEKEEFDLIGQLAQGGRVTSLDEDEDGAIWASAGYPHTHLVRFNPSANGKGRITDFGIVNDHYARCYFHASSYHNGKLYLGETDGFSPSLHCIDLKTIEKDKP
jgi:hypothetical protein